MALMTYEQWLWRVDEEVIRLCGLVTDDMPDYGYRDAYQHGESPKTTARKAVRAAGGF